MSFLIDPRDAEINGHTFCPQELRVYQQKQMGGQIVMSVDESLAEVNLPAKCN